MTKAELIDKISSGAKLSKADAAKALDSTLNSVKGALKKGQRATLVGFGTFSVVKRKARKGRNPQTAMLSQYLPRRSQSLQPARLSKKQ